VLTSAALPSLPQSISGKGMDQQLLVLLQEIIDIEKLDFSGLDFSGLAGALANLAKALQFGYLASENDLADAIRSDDPPNKVARLLRSGTSATGNSDYELTHMIYLLWLSLRWAWLPSSSCMAPGLNTARTPGAAQHGVCARRGAHMAYLPGYDGDTVPGTTWDGLVQLARCYDDHGRMVAALRVELVAARSRRRALPISERYIQLTAALAGCAPDAATALAGDTHAALTVLAALRDDGQLPGDPETFGALHDAMVGTLEGTPRLRWWARWSSWRARGSRTRVRGSGGSIP
jgi:hypothetical protein